VSDYEESGGQLGQEEVSEMRHEMQFLSEELGKSCCFQTDDRGQVKEVFERLDWLRNNLFSALY